MPMVEFKIGDQKFELVCDEGQQGRIRMLARTLDARVQELSKSFRGAPDNLILAIAGLTMEDEIRSLKEVKPQITEDERDIQLHNLINEVIIPISERIDELAEMLEKL